MRSGMPPVSVIVPHFQQQEALKQCLSCLVAQDYGGRVTIYIVDNSDSYGLKAWERDYPSVVFLWEPMPGSYHARNKAISVIKDEVIAFTDADCRPHPSWIREGVKRLLADDAIGIIGGQVIVTPAHDGAPTLNDWYEMATAFQQEHYIRRLHFAATANLFTRRSVFDRVGRFDSRLKSGGDTCWGLAAYRQGYRLEYAPDAIVEHAARNRRELQQKTLRLAGGRRDQEPGWPACLYILAYGMIPPVKMLAAVIRYRHPQLRLRHRLALTLYCFYYRWLFSYYRLKIELAGMASPR